MYECLCGCKREVKRLSGPGRKKLFYNGACRVNFLRRNKVGCSPEKYLELYEQQNGVCAVCKLDRPLVTDHCHKNNTVRGLLCVNCNAALGMLEDDMERILSLADYLKKYGVW